MWEANLVASVDDFMIFNVALTQTQISTVMNTRIIPFIQTKE